MSQTNVPSGRRSRARYSAPRCSPTQRQPSLMNNLTGPAPQQAAAEAKLKGQTSPDMPLVRVTDLSKSQGDQVSVDLINQTGGKPIMVTSRPKARASAWTCPRWISGSTSPRRSWTPAAR